MTVISDGGTKFLASAQTYSNLVRSRSSILPIAASCFRSLTALGFSVSGDTGSAPHRTGAKEASLDQVISSAGVLQNIEEFHGVNILTHEVRLLALIKTTPGRSLNFYVSLSGLSQRWFSVTLEKLLNFAVIEKYNSKTDERSTTLR